MLEALGVEFELAIGEVGMEVLKHINSRNHLNIIKLETRYMKQQRKGACESSSVFSLKTFLV